MGARAAGLICSAENAHPFGGAKHQVHPTVLSPQTALSTATGIHGIYNLLTSKKY
jgi:hypothetical protein